MTVAAILKHKGHEIAHTTPTTTVADAARELGRRRIGALLVLEGERLAGILSERDIVRHLAEHGHETLEMTGSMLMRTELETATTRTTVPEAMEMMTNGRFRHLPIVEEGRLIGVVSIGDIVKARISQQEQDMDSLKAYVAGA